MRLVKSILAFAFLFGIYLLGRVAGESTATYFLTANEPDCGHASVECTRGDR